MLTQKDNLIRDHAKEKPLIHKIHEVLMYPEMRINPPPLSGKRQRILEQKRWISNTYGIRTTSRIQQIIAATASDVNYRFKWFEPFGRFQLK